VTREGPAGPGPDPGWGARFLGLGTLPLVLASASPRLADLGVSFTVRAAAVSESPLAGEAPETTVVRLARAKALCVVRDGEEAIVVGADTIVVVDGAAFGKPGDAGEARRMLERLSGRTHRVLTGVAVVRSPRGRVVTDVAATHVRFRKLGSDEIGWMVDSGEAADKAGAYGIQGLGSLAVESIDGDYFNVVGLPLNLLRRSIRKAVLE
jgi:septum formation protein